MSAATKSERVDTLVFAQAVRELGVLARRSGNVMPAYRGSLHEPHSVERKPKGRVVVTINLDQPEWRALLDMFDGFLEAQRCPHDFHVDYDAPVIDTVPPARTYECAWCELREVHFDEESQ